ncbi:response regulator [bacterium]|jgi:signal transduction histidine kinase|nr:response regulator [bacterium]
MIHQVLRILLIDDDQDDLVIFRDHLSEIKNQQFDVQWAPSYEKGLDLLTSQNFDVCFLDYRLGGRTGLDLLKATMSNGVKTPIIILTGYGEHNVDLEAMNSGAADYLVKDQVDASLLERSIRYSIHRAQSMQAILDREAQILMQDRLASVGLLASSLAHEIGTPLGVIRGRAEYLELQCKDDAQIKKSLDIIISQIDRVSKLIRSLLNLARGNEVKFSENVNLRTVVSEVLDLMQHEILRNGIELKTNFSSDLEILVKAESGSLQQVLLNLLVNAVQAIDSAKGSGRKDQHSIRINLEETDSFWSLNIEDSGCGVSEKNLKNLFRPFFTTKDIGVGTGLGLATSYRIVESWGGSIQVKSIDGQGSVFTVLLPKSKK